MLTGNGLYALSQLLVILCLGRLLGAEAVGIYSFALAVVTPILIVFNLGLRVQLLTDSKGDIPLVTYERVRSVSSTVAMLALAASFVLFPGKSTIYLAIILVGAIKTFEYQSELFYGAFQKTNRYRIVAASLALKGLVSLASMALFVYTSNSLLTGLVAATIASALCCFLYDKRKQKFLLPDNGSGITWADARSIIITGVPLGSAALLISLNVNTPRLTLGSFGGPAALGQFASAAAFVQIGSLVVNSLGQALAPKMSAAFQCNILSTYKKIAVTAVLFSCGFGAVSAAAAYIIGPAAIEFVLGSKFTSGENILFFVFLAAPFQYAMSMFGYVISSTRKNSGLVYVNAISALVTLCASLAFVPQFGIYGAAYALISGSLCGCIVYAILLRVIFSRHGSNA